MKRFLLISILSLIVFPIIVFADETCANETVDVWCTGSECLNKLQKDYNTWYSTGNSGKSCIKVIAQRNGEAKTYFSGKNPKSDYKCLNGKTPDVKLVSSSLSDRETNVTECNNSTCYIPELWAMDCKDGNVNSSSSSNASSSNSTSNSGTSSNSGTNSNSNGNNSEILSKDDNVQTNSQGQIIGTTDAKDTGVETYFIVLFIMGIIAYMILMLTNKKTFFKSV